MRYRKALVRERSAEVNRLQKTLEGANIKLASVASDVLGKSGRTMLETLVARTTDPEVLAALAKGRLQGKQAQLEQALRGLMGPHQRLLLATQLQHVDFLDQQITQLSQEIEQRMRAFESAPDRLQTIPGVSPHRGSDRGGDRR